MITFKSWGNIYTVTCGVYQQDFDTLADAFKCITMLNAIMKARGLK